MNAHTRLELLIELAERIGLTIRREPLGGDGGGLCALRGKRILFVDTLADEQTGYDRTVAALAPLPDWETCYLPPQVRDDLERARAALTES